MFLLFLGFSCDYTVEKKEKTVSSKKTKKKTGVNKVYYEDGTLRAEVNVVDGKRNGLARDFYPNGKPHLEIQYKDGLKHGLTKMYYENGKLYEESGFDTGEKHGIQKKYRQDGKVLAEAKYHFGEPCAGLKEYLKDGSLKKKYPTIEVTPIDNILKSDSYTLRLSMSDKSKNVTFYEGRLDGNCIGENVEQVHDTPSKGIGQIKYYVPHGMVIMERLTIIAKVKTLQGNYYVTSRPYNVAVENR